MSRSKTPLAPLLVLVLALGGGGVAMAGCDSGDNRSKQGDPTGQGETSPTATPSESPTKDNETTY